MSETYSYLPPGSRPARPDGPVASKGPVNYRVKLLSAVNSMPPMPTALNTLLGMLNDESCSAGQIASVIEQDSVLSGSVLRSVNSAYYGLPGRVSAIRQAVTLLGFSTMRNLALAFSMRRMMSRNQPSPKLYTAYSRHALACAIMTQFLAHVVHADDVEPAFAAGLFHDIGKLLILSNAPEALPGIVEIWEDGEEPYQEAERQVLEVTHSELSAIILEGWRLPEPIRLAARYHHSPAEQGEQEPGSPSLAELVHAADLAVNFEGIRTTPSSKRPAADPSEALEALGVDAAEPLLRQFREEFEGLQGVFQ